MVQVRLYPTPAQAAILRAHYQEYIRTINVLIAALDCDMLPDGGKATSTKDFTASLPSAVKNQALRDARSIWKRSLTVGVLAIVMRSGQSTLYAGTLPRHWPTWSQCRCRRSLRSLTADGPPETVLKGRQPLEL